MAETLCITPRERDILRSLAETVRAYAALPVMEERRKLWYAHNALRGERPIIVMEMLSFMDDMIQPLQCRSNAAREIESWLLCQTVNYELVGDDKVVPDSFPIPWQISKKTLGLDLGLRHSKDTQGRELGYEMLHPIQDLRRDIHLLQPSEYHLDRDGTMAWKAFVDGIIGDILPTRITNDTLNWFYMPTALAVHMMGMQNLLMAMIDYPDEFHQMMDLIHDDIIGYARWQQKEGLLCLNNGNDYAGAGSFGFTSELPKSAEFAESGLVTTSDIWLNMNSQESVGLSPSMYEEFIFPNYLRAAEEFGLVYYGCCEPVHDIWDDCLSRLANLRKVSVSAWCDEEFIGSRLRGSGVIYSRKPSPNFIGVGETLDEPAYSDHIARTLRAASGCHLEIIFRDIYTVSGDRSKPGRAVEIARSLIDTMWA